VRRINNQVRQLACVTTPYEMSEKVSRAFNEQSMLMIQQDPGDEVITPCTLSEISTA
jgi:hypothetical protein